MTIIPWRLKSFLSGRVPLLYHLVVNLGKRGNSPEHWDKRLAETWDAPERSWPTRNELIASLSLPSDLIVDIGCDNGSLHLSGRGYGNLHGVEISRYAILRLSEGGILTHFGLLPRIRLQDAAFDVVIASQVLEHIIRRRRFLREIARVLKPGGRELSLSPIIAWGRSTSGNVSQGTMRYLCAKCSVLDLACSGLRSIRDANHPMSVLFAHVMKPVS